jgi:hypothetical protein
MSDISLKFLTIAMFVNVTYTNVSCNICKCVYDPSPYKTSHTHIQWFVSFCHQIERQTQISRGSQAVLNSRKNYLNKNFMFLKTHCQKNGRTLVEVAVVPFLLHSFAQSPCWNCRVYQTKNTNVGWNLMAQCSLQEEKVG